jgi:acyl dehydratase
MSASIITDEIRAQIGQLTQPPVSARITARDAQRYAMAVDDLNPVYFDEAAAQAAGYRTLVAPPTFVGHVVAATKPLSELRDDGLFRGGSKLKLGLPRVMAGGDAWEHLEPAYVDDVVTAESRLAEITQRDGSKGTFVTSVVETVFTNQDGVIVAKLRQTAIAR